MPAKKLFLFLLASSFFCNAAISQVNQTSTASLGKVKLQFGINENGQPSYAVFFDGKPVVLPSWLGFKLSDGLSLDSSLSVVKTVSTAVP